MARRGIPTCFWTEPTSKTIRCATSSRRAIRRATTPLSTISTTGRLFDYLNLGLAFPLRKDYARYIEWVARQFDEVAQYGTDVVSIELARGFSSTGERLYEVSTKSGARYSARSLVVGIGRTPNIPSVFRPVLGPKVFHFTEYLARTGNGSANGRAPFRRICVVGGSQSSVEITLDLMRRYPECEIVNVMRNYGYRLKDTSPFSDHVYFPEFVDYFYRASPESKRRLWEELKFTNYSSADGDVIHELYLKLYEQKLDGRNNVRTDAQSRSSIVFRTGGMASCLRCVRCIRDRWTP